MTHKPIYIFIKPLNKSYLVQLREPFHFIKFILISSLLRVISSNPFQYERIFIYNVNIFKPSKKYIP